jgi:hypothetical protein
MQKTAPKIGHLDENEIIRIQLEYVRYATD